MTVSSSRPARHHIAIIASHLPRGDNGGAERQALRTAVELARRGHDVSLFVRGLATHSQRHSGVRIVERTELHLPRAAAKLSALRFVWDVARALTDMFSVGLTFDIVLTYNTLICGFIGAVYSIVAQRPLVLWIRGEGEYRGQAGLRGRVLAPFAWLIARTILLQTPSVASDFVTAVLQLVPGPLATCITRKVRVLPNGLDVPNQWGPPESQGELLFAGRLVRRKGLEHLLRALPAIPCARLTVIGEGVDGARLEALAAGLPVRFIGSRPQQDLVEYYRQATLLVLPSTFGEGLPNAVLEAMACGRPVVVTRTAGTVDLVRDGVNGVLVEPGDADALASAIRSLLEAPMTLRAMGVAARQTAASYDWRALIPKLEDTLTEAMSPRRVSSGHTSRPGAPTLEGWRSSGEQSRIAASDGQPGQPTAAASRRRQGDHDGR